MSTAPLARRIAWTGIAIALSLALGACSSDDDDDTAGMADAGATDGGTTGGGTTGGGDGAGLPADTYEVTLSPRQEVPPVAVDGASGSASLTVDETGLASGTLTLTGLTATAAHIHEGAAGMNGDVIVTLEAGADANTFTVPVDTMLTAAQQASLASGGLYFNAHTAANPGGEVRGQIVPDDASFSLVELSGANEVPTVTTDASAVGTALVDADGLVTATIITSGLDDATGAHIHTGIAGENGDVLIALEQDAADSSVWRAPAAANLDAAGRTAFENGGLYFNVHTPANPGGEVRGQL